MGITKELDQKLENAFENLKEDIQNPLVISHLQSDDNEVNIYLIAKDPDTDIYYGILETKYINKRQIAGIPRQNILVIEVKEKPIIPFRAKAYIETGKIERGNSLSGLFIEDKEFQEKIMQIHFFKSEEYIILNKEDLLFSLGFSRGFDSVLMCVASTQVVINYKVDENGNILFNYKTGIFGIPIYTNIVDLFPLLTKYCFQSKSVQDLFINIENSKNGQLLCFGNSLKEKANPVKLKELVSLLDRPESNPNIQIENLNINQLNKDILVLNPSAFENIFKNYITDAIMKSYNK